MKIVYDVLDVNVKHYFCALRRDLQERIKKDHRLRGGKDRKRFSSMALLRWAISVWRGES
jgi:hypothetical protein